MTGAVKMTEYKINNVTVRIFGIPNEERIKEACKQYVKGLNYELLERNFSTRNNSHSSTGRKTKIQENGEIRSFY
jgi:hypothetical protein